MLRASAIVFAFSSASAQQAALPGANLEACLTLEDTQVLHAGADAMSGTDFLPNFLQGFESVFASAIHSNSHVEQFIASKSQCQMDCLGNTSTLAARTMWGMGRFQTSTDEGMVQAQHDIEQAMTGAIRACYPSAPREAVLETVQNLFTDSHPAPWTIDQLDLGNDCDAMRSSPGRDEFLSSFDQLIGPSVQQALSGDSCTDRAITNMITGGKACQMECVETAFKQAARTLWDSGNVAHSGDEYARDALVGAIKMCFPRADQEDVQDFTDEVVNNLNAASSEAHAANTRLYLAQGKFARKTGATPLTMLFAAAAGFVLFLGGVIAGRRSSMTSQARMADARGSPLVDADLE